MIGTRSECDRLSCERNQTVFNLLYHKNNNEYFYCVNRQKLGEYWRCVIEDRDPFYPNKDHANNQEDITYQSILLKPFTSIINKNNKKFRIEIGKSIPNQSLVLNYGKTC